jgi:putative ABC transport system permease protein
MPDWKEEITERLRALKLAAAREAEIVEELSQHLEDRYKELVIIGTGEEEARRVALEELSEDDLLATGLRRVERGVSQESFVPGGGGRDHSIESIWLDLRYGLRTLGKSPGFTAVAVLTLALAIGANTAVFSVVNAVLLRPLGYRDPHHIVRVWENDTHGGLGPFSVSVPNFIDWRHQNEVFENMGAFASVPMALTGGHTPEQIRGAYVTASVIRLLPLRPIIGRGFLPEEDQPGKDHEAILSYGLWQQRFGADPAALGKTVILDGNTYAVVGIAQAGFDFPPNSETEIWVPMAFTPSMLQQRAAHILNVVARLKPGKTLRQARSDMDTIARRLEQQYPASNTGWRVIMLPLHDSAVVDVRPPLLVLLAAVGFVLLIACANIANLFLARVAARQKEVAIRIALGAGRVRLVRQFLTESILLATLGGALALLFAVGGLHGLLALKPPDLPVIGKFNFDWRVWTFASFATFASALLFGLAPTVRGIGGYWANALKEGGRSVTAGRGSQKLRHALIVAEFSLATVLLIGAGLLVRSLLRLQEVNPGFDPRNVLTAEISLPESQYREPYRQAAFFEQLVKKLESTPGVRSAGAVNADNVVEFTIEGRTPSKSSERIIGKVRWATPDYFQTMRIPLLKGRLFSESDNERAPKVILINQTMVHRYFGNEDPIGKRMFIGWGTPAWREIIGVVGDVKYRGLAEEPGDEFYIPLAQTPINWMTVAIRTAGDPLAFAPSLPKIVWSLDKSLPVSNLKTMQQRIGESVAQPRFRTILLGIFAGLALVLASIGIYGVVSYLVAQQYHDFGIRMALGAKPRDVLKLALWQTLKILVVGATIGLAGALTLTRLISRLLYGIGPSDPPTFFIVFALLFGVALLASYVPARRATQVDPLVALRYE